MNCQLKNPKGSGHTGVSQIRFHHTRSCVDREQDNHLQGALNLMNRQMGYKIPRPLESQNPGGSTTVFYIIIFFDNIQAKY